MHYAPSSDRSSTLFLLDLSKCAARRSLCSRMLPQPLLQYISLRDFAFSINQWYVLGRNLRIELFKICNADHSLPMILQRAQYAESKSDIVSRLDGTYSSEMKKRQKEEKLAKKAAKAAAAQNPKKRRAAEEGSS